MRTFGGLLYENFSFGGSIWYVFSFLWMENFLVHFWDDLYISLCGDLCVCKLAGTFSFSTVDAKCEPVCRCNFHSAPIAGHSPFEFGSLTVRSISLLSLVA